MSCDFVIESGVLKKYEGPGGDVVIPEGVSSIGVSAFENCSSVTSVVIPEGVCSIGKTAFSSCKNLSAVILPESLNEICSASFFGCSSLKSIIIPGKVKRIERQSFCDCSGLISATLSEGVTIIDSMAFYKCYNLSSIVLPKSLTKISSVSFFGCSSLTSVAVPENVKEIDTQAFGDCSSLMELTIPDGARILGPIIYGCRNLKTLNASKENKEIIYNHFDLDEVFVKKRETFTGEVIREIFAYQNKPIKNKKAILTSLIENDAAEALGVLLDMKFVANTKIRDELIKLASSSDKAGAIAVLLAYKEKTGNREKEVKSEGKKQEKELNMPVGKLLLKDLKASWNFRLIKDSKKKQYEIRGYKGNETVVEIPSKIDGIPVTQIAEKAFSSYAEKKPERAEVLNSITEVIIPKSITRIGESAFNACQSLKKVIIPPNVISMGSSVFFGCTSLEEVQMPDGLLLYGDKTFKYCSALKSISVAKSRTTITTSEFSHCISLVDVVIPDHVDEIEGWAFSNCTDLKSVSIHGAVKKIHKTAFSDCPNLTIHAPAGSYAETYAKENGIPYVAD